MIPPIPSRLLWRSAMSLIVRGEDKGHVTAISEGLLQKHAIDYGVLGLGDDQFASREIQDTEHDTLVAKMR